MRVNRLAYAVPAAAVLWLTACSKPTPSATDAASPAAQASAEELVAREAQLRKREEELASREAGLEPGLEAGANGDQQA